MEPTQPSPIDDHPAEPEPASPQIPVSAPPSVQSDINPAATIPPPAPNEPTEGPTVTHQGFGAVPKAIISPDQPLPGATIVANGPNQAAVVSPPKKKNLIKRLLIPIAVLLVLVGGSAAAYFYYYLPNQPKNIILSAFINMVSGNKLRSADFTSTSSVGVSSKQTIDESLVGSVGQGGKFDLKLSVDAYLTTITAEALSPDGNNVYFKIGGLDGLSQILKSVGESAVLNGYSSLINSINNQWYQINQSLVNEFKNNVGLNNVSSLSSSDASKLESIYKKNDFLTVLKTFPSQAISGMNSYHYQISVDNNRLQAFINAVASAHLQSFKLEQSELNSITSSLKGVNTASHPIGIWISKSDKFIDQLSISGTSANNPYSSTLTFTSFNQPVAVTAPANAKSILQLISQISSQLNIFSGLSGTSLPTGTTNLGVGQVEPL